jgi:hypothetical protein
VFSVIERNLFRYTIHFSRNVFSPRTLSFCVFIFFFSQALLINEKCSNNFQFYLRFHLRFHHHLSCTQISSFTLFAVIFDERALREINYARYKCTLFPLFLFCNLTTIFHMTFFFSHSLEAPLIVFYPYFTAKKKKSICK